MKTIKAKQPEFTVDLTWCKTPNDIYVAFGCGKQQAGLPMTDSEFCAIIIAATRVDKWGREIAENIVKLFDVEDWCKVVKKPNIFKRFWNWITRKK